MRLKKIYKEALKPKKPFEVWAAEHGVKLTHKPEAKRKRNIQFKRIMAAAAACILVIGVSVPVIWSLLKPQANTIPDDGDITITEPPEKPKEYKAKDADAINITIDEIYQIDDLILFNRENIMNKPATYIEVPNDDDTTILSYDLNNCLLSVDAQNAFYVDYKIRIYEYYEFYFYENYQHLSQDFEIGDIKILYEIVDDEENNNKAYLSFQYNKIDYFLCAKAFAKGTDVTESTLIILMDFLLKNIT